VNLEAVWNIFAENFTQRGELGASVSIWQGGVEVLSLADGFRDRNKTLPWTAQTPVLVWSATKGPSSACLLHALHTHGLDLDRRVAEVWPEFGRAQKEWVTFGELLSHRAGLAVLERDVRGDNYPAVIEALEDQPRLWTEGHGYHPRTFGWLLDECVRRISGMRLGDYWHVHFAERWGLDFWIGLPAEKLDEVATMLPPKLTGTLPKDDFYEAFADPDSFPARAFNSPRGQQAVAAMNTPAMRCGQFPGFGGIGTAHALAKFYNGLLSEPYLPWATTTLSSGFDRVLLRETAFAAGFMKSQRLFGPSESAFGQPGAGGSMAFADPENRITFAYVMNQMEQGVLPNEKALCMMGAVYERG